MKKILEFFWKNGKRDGLRYWFKTDKTLSEKNQDNCDRSKCRESIEKCGILNAAQGQNEQNVEGHTFVHVIKVTKINNYSFQKFSSIFLCLFEFS